MISNGKNGKVWEPSDKLIEFCRSARSRRGCFGRWPAARIRDYLQHHHEQNSLVVVWENGEVLAVGTGAQCNRSDTENPYLPDRPDGRCLFLEAIIVTAPDCFLHMIQMMLQRWPRWRELQIISRRNGRIVDYDQKVIGKFAEYGWRHVGPVFRGRRTDRVLVPEPVPA